MNTRLSKWIFVCVVFGLSLQSCSEDTSIVDTELDETTAEARRSNNGQNGRGGSNGQGGENNGNDVSRIDNSLLSEWTELFLELERYAAGMRPNASARAIAYTYLAAYETAQPGMDNYISNTTQLGELSFEESFNTRNIDYEIALNACFADVLDHFLLNVPPNLKSKIIDLEDTNATALNSGKRESQIESSIAWGEHVANRVIAYSLTDFAAEEQVAAPQPTSYIPPTGDGFWTYSADPERALFPYWESVRTFVISTDETTTLAPIVYSENTNSEYFKEMQEAYDVNNAAKADQGEQLWIAEFWSDDVEGLMFSPPARQISIANQLIDQYTLNMAESLVLFVKVGFALNDAAVSTWKYKYEHMVMRPSNYIHDFIDPSFQTNLYRLIYWPNPSFPGYPSGHSSFASAAGGIFSDTFGEETNFTDRSHEGRTEFQSSPRTFSSFKQLAEENAYSRIPLGVHIRMDCKEGVRLGYEISDALNKYQLSRRQT